jgi:hypothetical protein
VPTPHFAPQEQVSNCRQPMLEFQSSDIFQRDIGIHTGQLVFIVEIQDLSQHIDHPNGSKDNRKMMSLLLSMGESQK